jgi:hypothetical protein
MRATCVSTGFAVLLASSAALAQRPIPVNVESTPPGAQIFLDVPTGTSIGTTPAKGLKIVKGQHTLHFTLAAHEPGQLPVNVRRRNETFRVTLVPFGRIDLSGTGDAQGASVSIDGETVGQIPVSKLLKQGRHEVRVSKEGFQEYAQWFEVTPGETRAQAIVLERQRAAAGSLLVAGDVPGAPVFVDGQDKGRSPVVIDGLDAGAHAVEIRPEGLPVWSQTVSVESGQRVTVNPRLQPERPPTGSVRIIANVDGAQVILDGDPIGVVPADAADLVPGSHIVEVTAPGFHAGRQDVQVEAGQRRVVRLELEALPRETPHGQLRVVSPVPNAQVFLDGQLAGTAPLEKNDLAIGTHFITVQASGYRDWVRSVSLTAGHPVELSAEMTAVSVLRVRANVEGAAVFLDGDRIGLTPFESSSAPAGDHELVVKMRGWSSHREQLTLTPGQPREIAVTLTQDQVGATEAERIAMMPWAAGALPQGEVALDVDAGWPYLAEFRLGVGILPLIDAGVGIQTYLRTTEIAGRLRFLVHPFQAIGVGIQGQVGGGLGPDERDAFLLSGGGLATLFFANKGAFTLNLDIESSSERIASKDEAVCDRATPPVEGSFEASNAGCERDENLRLILGGTLELVMSRSWNFFGNFRGALGHGDRFAYHDILTLGNGDGGLYFKVGLTYKF